jgi:4-hydroxybutyrate CoA-transferase
MQQRERDLLGAKLVAVPEAVAEVQSGDVVAAAPFSCTPFTLCQALAERAGKDGLKGVRIDHPASFFPWTDPAWASSFSLVDNYATAANRAACHAGETGYLPVGSWMAYEVPPGWCPTPDVYFVPVSPPDASGYCSYGPGVWFSGTLTRGAKKVIAEVHPGFIRTGGENYIHVSEIDAFVEAEQATGGVPGVPPNEEEIAATDVICNLVAAELVNDGDTLQLGVGTVSASVAQFLGFRNDLGIQTELITGGIAGLVEQGVVTGRYKTIHKHKVVGSALVALSDEEMAKIDGNPVFELYDFGYTDDLRQLIQIENFVTINNAMIVDLTGQVAAESFDHRPYTGVGGQTVFMIAGAYSPGGKSVSVLPSSSVPTGTGQRVSRIVAGLPPGTPVTVPRTYVDFVVTEHGIAELRGKTVAERAASLIEIAHPDFREELRSEAKRLYSL